MTIDRRGFIRSLTSAAAVVLVPLPARIAHPVYTITITVSCDIEALRAELREKRANIEELVSVMEINYAR